MEGRALLSREDMPMVGESYPRQIYQGPGNFSVKGRRVSGGRGFIPGDGDGDDA